MSPIDRKVRKRAKAKAKAQAEAKAKAKAKTEAEAKAKAKAEAIAKAKAMFSRSNQSENPAFRALVDKLRGIKLGEPNTSFFKDFILESVTPIYDVADFHKSNVYSGSIDEYGDVNMVYETVDFADDVMMW